MSIRSPYTRRFFSYSALRMRRWEIVQLLGKRWSGDQLINLSSCKQYNRVTDRLAFCTKGGSGFSAHNESMFELSPIKSLYTRQVLPSQVPVFDDETTAPSCYWWASEGSRTWGHWEELGVIVFLGSEAGEWAGCEAVVVSERRSRGPKEAGGDGSEAEIERLLQQLNEVNKLMATWVSNAGSDVLSHTLARHRNILHELSQVVFRSIPPLPLPQTQPLQASRFLVTFCINRVFLLQNEP